MLETIVEALYKKEPRYLEEYKYLFLKYCRKGAGDTEKDRLLKSKVFRTHYEFYMYAFFLGFRKRLKIKLLDRSKKISDGNVWNIANWKPENLRMYLIACVLAEINIPLIDYEYMGKDEIEKISSKLRDIIEEYAYGGFSIIDGCVKTTPDYFDEYFAFTDFVFEKEELRNPDKEVLIKIKKEISKDRTERALEQLNNLNILNEKQSNKLSLLSARLERLREHKLNGTEDQSQIGVERNRINQSLLVLLDNIL